ncbi:MULTISPECIES: hypothetical protein [unclassified Streptomyces]|uniref:hypothetical protein n=1 Tax=unclassified Streptomyces TaxID=2593676 RepID=UPI002E2B2324|nr:hypothetical protein [Streptomyces sp. NBC_00273]
MHTYDAQITEGDPQPLPDEVALDGDRRLFEQLSARDPNEWDVTMRHLVRPGARLPPTAATARG